jgi:hypothetical protein
MGTFKRVVGTILAIIAIPFVLTGTALIMLAKNLWELE